MYAVIMAGGSGARLWPVSRELSPKQFMEFGDDKKSLFQETILRVAPVIPENRILVVARDGQGDNVRRQLSEIGVRGSILLEEPRALNTAPAIGLAARYLAETVGEDAIMAVLPSDHVILPWEEFAALLARGREAAIAYGLVTFGIRPTYPETGYGYICCGKQLDEWAFKVERFVEKPALALAEEYVRDTRFLWNSGMFVFKVGELLAQYRRHLPSIAAGLDKVDYRRFTNLKDIYNEFRAISIDYGVLEKSDGVAVIPANITWSDMGSWEALYRISPKDADGNHLHGRVVGIDTRNCLIHSQGKLVGLIGVENLVVVATDDALLVCSRERSQETKALVDKMKSSGAIECMVHPTVQRPWGEFAVLEDQESYKVKRLSVDPGKRLSLQSHRRRSEHWLVARGRAMVTVNDEQRLLQEGDHVFIPVNARHRLENPGEGPLEVIEVQKGDYFGEDDITRYEDDYGRSGPEDPNRAYQEWLCSEVIDAKTRQELQEIAGDLEAIRERFSSELAFGTGGLRGIAGAGLNRMNVYVVRKATQGLANCIREQYEGAAGLKVVIAHDTRLHSREFAEETALVLAANGIKALMFSDARPTPLLSFAIRELGCVAGVVITASHNPCQYNGYKVYGPDGGQAVSPLIDDLTRCIRAVDTFRDVRTVSRAEAEGRGLLESIDPAVDRLYSERVASLSLSRPRRRLRVVFTPLHGTGACFIPALLRQAGFVDLAVVKEQMTSDPSFTTVRVPNPEDRESFAMALDLARRENADLVMATDPDCDRLGCAVRDEEGGHHFLTGNEVGALLLDYLLGRLQEKGRLPAEGAMVKTIVTGDLGAKIADSYGIKTIETLTGFKYIGEMIKRFEEERSHSFLFGYEESCGYLTGTFVRDKDANIAALLAAEMAAYHKERGRNLLQALEDLHRRFGYYNEDLVSLESEDESAMRSLMAAFSRQTPDVAGMRLVTKRDYRLGTSLNVLTGQEERLTLPRAEALYYRFSDDSWFCVRPSGTEPKIKFYFSVNAARRAEAEEKLDKLRDSVLSMCKTGRTPSDDSQRTKP